MKIEDAVEMRCPHCRKIMKVAVTENLAISPYHEMFVRFFYVCECEHRCNIVIELEDES